MIIMTCVISSMISIVIWHLNRPMASLISWMLAAFAGTLSFSAWVAMPWLRREIAIPINMTILTGSPVLNLDGVLRFRGLIQAGRLHWMTPAAMLIEAVQVIVNLTQDWLRITPNNRLNSLILIATFLLHRARRDERTGPSI